MDSDAPSIDEVVIQTASGARLAADVWEPRGAARATVLLGHAMMASRRTFVRRGGQGLAPLLCARGYRVVPFDFRGHGGSGPPASIRVDWSYDDLVREDVPAIVSALRDRFDGPIVLAGHSLGAHVTAAAIGTDRTSLDGLVLLAGNVWLPRLEPSLRRRARKTASLAAVLAIVTSVRKFPARAMGIGSDDEARSYLAAFFRWWKSDAWTSDDGRDDYLASLARVRCPVLSIASEGDVLDCVPACAERFLDYLGAPDRTFHVVRGPDAPGHMQLVTDVASEPAWSDVASWLDERFTG